MSSASRLELREALAVRGDHVERRIDVAELVVEIRADDVRRQIAADVADLLAHLVPQLLHPPRRRGVGERDLDEGVAGLRIAGDAIEERQLLQLLLDLVDDLRLQLGGGRARPADVDVHDLDGEGRVFRATELGIRIDPGGADQQDHEQHQRLMRDRPFRQIEALHDVAPRSLLDCVSRASMVRTRRPASSVWTPSVTIRSPLLMPPVTSAASPVKDGDRDRPQRQRAVVVDHVDRRPGAAIEHGGERHARHRRLALALEHHRRGHAERDVVIGVEDREARRKGAGRRVGLRRKLAQPRLEAAVAIRPQPHGRLRLLRLAEPGFRQRHDGFLLALMREPRHRPGRSRRPGRVRPASR